MAYNTVQNARVFILSQRNLRSHVSRCWMYEFEDTICAVDAVDMLMPTYSGSELNYKLANRVAKISGMVRTLNTGINKFVVNKDYELFIACFHHPSEILSLNSIKGWREKCSKAVCLLVEVWEKDVPTWRHHLRLLKDFDHVFLNLSSSVNAIANIIDRPCHYMPYGVDAISFCPYPFLSHRSVDLYSAGHRSPMTHRALLNLVQQGQFFYIYDTIKDLYVNNYQEHRQLFSNLVKKSRYFIANSAKINSVDSTGGQEELSPRFFEGAAGGAILLGTPPACEDYHRNFDWPDAVTQLPYDALDVVSIIADLDSQPERLATARKNNVVNSLLRHDWVYRWRKILDTVLLEPTSQMIDRETYLKNLAELVDVQKSKVAHG